MTDEMNKRRAAETTAASQGSSAAEIQAWHERERRIQAEIARHRATPYYMAIAFDFPNQRILGGGGYYTQERAVEMALSGCQSFDCHVVAVFANACGVVVTPDSGIRTAEDIFVGIDPDDRRAAEEAMQACEARHGGNQCGYSTVKTKNGTAFCAGYDYSVYMYSPRL